MKTLHYKHPEKNKKGKAEDTFLATVQSYTMH